MQPEGSGMRQIEKMKPGGGIRKENGILQVRISVCGGGELEGSHLFRRYFYKMGIKSGLFAALFLLPIVFCACAGKTEKDTNTLHIAAAASLEKCLTEELIPLFEAEEGVKVVGMYDSSGKLQTQMEEGAEVDLFFSASWRQTDALAEQELLQADTVTELLENKIVLIVPAGDEGDFQRFEDIVRANIPAIGDPDIVPAGQYAKEALQNLGLWEAVYAKASLGTNVTEVLSWVAQGSAQAGIVYATDAAQTDQVTVIAEAPEGSAGRAVYPAAIVKDCANPSAAAAFLEFLCSEEAMSIFQEYGFTPANR